MQIKDLRHFREFFKSNIREITDENRDVHFIGTDHYDDESETTTFGFFDLYHGQKSKGDTDGIKGFLKGFLDMAQDAQAIYEFLQNAVDADSSHFLMVWGKDDEEKNENGSPAEYLLVLNNGKQFDFPAMESILNVGVSQKLEHEHTIGKFGIGFKLAHRLVGKENGLEELVENNYGPILFSWKNDELRKLVEGDKLTFDPIQQDYQISRNKGSKRVAIKTEDPWLLKILISNFPAQPDEEIRDAYYRQRKDIFTTKDVHKVQDWLARNKDVIPLDQYAEGSMFFLKLGSDKIKTLEGDYILEGIKFSMAILSHVSNLEVQGLKQVHINGANIEGVPLKFESINISKNSEEYNFIRFGKREDLTETEKGIVEKDSDIQFLFGYTDYQTADEIFNNVPNFYLYFPMTEEKHGLKFILHTNAFYKKSARTSLHSDEINIRLLNAFATQLIKILKRDPQKFIEIYPLLLSTKISKDNDKLWINTPLIEPIHKFITTNIPVVCDNELGYSLIRDKEEIRIKKTLVDVYQGNDRAPFQWFYFGDDEILNNSVNENLNLFSFTIKHLLRENQIFVKINKWLNKEDAKIKIFIGELNEIALTLSQNDKNTLKENLFQIKFIKFNNGEVLSINEFQDLEEQGYLYKFGYLKQTQDILINLGFFISTDDIENIIDAFRNNFSTKSQLKDYAILAEIFSKNVTDKSLSKLTNDEKFKLFYAFEEIHKTSEKDVISHVKIYKNNLGKHHVVKNLVRNGNGFFKNLSVDENQLIGIANTTSIDRNFKFEAQKTFENLFYPLWSDILEYLARKDDVNISSLKGEIDYSYRNSNWIEKDDKQFSDHKSIIFEKKIIATDKICTYKDGTNIIGHPHEDFQNTALNIFHTYLPDTKFLELISEDKPYTYNNKIGKLKLNLLNVEVHEINKILLLCKKVGIRFFQENIIIRNGNNYNIISDVDEKQFYSKDLHINTIVDHRFSSKLIALPDEFVDFVELIHLKDRALFDHVSESLSDNSTESERIMFLKAVLSQDVLTQERFFNNLPQLTFFSNDQFNSNVDYLKLVYSIKDQISIEELQQKIVIAHGDERVELSTLPRFVEKIVLQDFEIEYKNLIPTTEKEVEEVIKKFVQKFVVENDFSRSFYFKLFKIENNISHDDLKNEFITNLSADKILINIEQLFFVVKSGLFDLEEIGIYKVVNSLSQFINIEGHIFRNTTDTKSLILPERILSDSYNTNDKIFSALLNNQSNDLFFIFDNLKINNSTNYEVLNDALDPLDKVNLLFFAYIYTDENERSINENKVIKFLNINIDQFYLFSSNDNFSDFQKQILAWSNNDETKSNFFKKIGFVFDDDNLSVLLRMCKGESLTLDNINDVSEKEVTQLFSILKKDNSIIDLAEENLIDVLQSLVQKFSLSDSLLIVPCYNTKKSIKFSDIGTSFILDNLILESTLTNDEDDLKWSQFFKVQNIISKSFERYFDRPTINTEFVLETDNCEEFDSYYYSDWKRDVTNLKLFQADYLYHKVIAQVDAETYDLGLIKRSQTFEVKPIGNSLEVYFTKDLSIHFLAQHFQNNDEYETYNLSLNLKKLENKHNSFNTQITEALKNTALDELRDMFEAQIKKQESDNRRSDIAEAINELNDSDLKYSKQWFIQYLQYLKTFVESADSNKFETIRFRKIEKLDENGFYKLSSASAYIPENIDESKNRNIKVVFKDNRKDNIDLTFVSKKNQDLIIKTPRIYSDSDLAKIFQLELLYIPNIDLLSRLEFAFRSLDEWEDYKISFPAVNYIYGPPGTGKTTEIQRKIQEIVSDNADAKILILTPTNKACDVIGDRLLKEKFESFYRLAGKTSDDIPDQFYKNDIELGDLIEVNVIISTIHRFPYYNWVPNSEENSLRGMKEFWDYLIIDEASMITAPYITFACMNVVQKNKNVKIIIAGDPKQIPPIPELNDADLELIKVKTENIYSMFNLSSFIDDEQNLIKRPIDVIENLPIQYRSVPEIGNLFSGFSYDHRVQSKRLTSSLRKIPKTIGKLFTQSVNFVSVPLTSEDALYSHNKLMYSSYHIYTTILVTEILKYLEDFVEDEKWTVGIISPYKAQAILINKLIGDFGFKDKIKITADTVHGFQGDECDIIFYLVTPNGNRYSGHPDALLSKDYIYNVAISRAQEYLVVVHPFTDIPDNIHINNILQLAKNEDHTNVNVINSSDIENEIFGSNNYIDSKTLVGGHENVNIYTDFTWKYYVKRSSSAIDFQVQKS